MIVAVDMPPPALAASVRVAHSTAYCLRGLMADGTRVRTGSVAMNTLPLGTRIRLVGSSFDGRRVFVVRDRIGWGSALDFWTPSCAKARLWGRRRVAFRVLPARRSASRGTR